MLALSTCDDLRVRFRPSNVFLFAYDFDGGRIWVARATSECTARSSNTNSSGEAATIEKLVQRAPILLWAYRILRFAPLQIMVYRRIVSQLALESKYSTLFLQNPNSPRLRNWRCRYCRAGITFDGLAARDRPTDSATTLLFFGETAGHRNLRRRRLQRTRPSARQGRRVAKLNGSRMFYHLSDYH